MLSVNCLISSFKRRAFLHVRRHQHHRAMMAFGHFGYQRGAGGAGEFAKLALIAGF